MNFPLSTLDLRRTTSFIPIVLIAGLRRMFEPKALTDTGVKFRLIVVGSQTEWMSEKRKKIHGFFEYVEKPSIFTLQR